MAKTLTLYPKRGGMITASTNVAAAVRKLDHDLKAKILTAAIFPGATVMYNSMRRNAPYRRGTLRESIYRWLDKRQTTDYQRYYAVGPNKRIARHWHWLEYGNRHMAPQPYIKPTFDQNRDRVLMLMKEKLREAWQESAKNVNQAVK